MPKLGPRCLRPNGAFTGHQPRIALCLKTIFCGLTPELSWPAQRPSGEVHDTAQGEAAKRARLERLVRRESACWIPCRRHDRGEQICQSFRELTAAGNCLPNDHESSFVQSPPSAILRSQVGSSAELASSRARNCRVRSQARR